MECRVFGGKGQICQWLRWQWAGRSGDFVALLILLLFLYRQT